jgi:hypothetical protein
MKTGIQAFWLLAFCLGMTPSAVQANDGWFASVYTGRFSDTALWEIALGTTELESSRILVFSLGRELGPLRPGIDLEWEGQISRHSGAQSHHEVNTAVTVRWQRLPWDRRLDTSFAVGNGLSYASEKPFLEERESPEEETSNLLYYILIELAFTTRAGHWEPFIRAHHRSSAYGLFNRVDAGSNYAGIGIRYRVR